MELQESPSVPKLPFAVAQSGDMAQYWAKLCFVLALNAASDRTTGCAWTAKDRAALHVSAEGPAHAWLKAWAASSSATGQSI